jgi:hydroxyacylglutathione hydrolase
MIQDRKNQDPENALVTTLGQEKEINTFFRLQNSSVVEKLVEDFPEIGNSPDARAVFLKLRELRNSW